MLSYCNKGHAQDFLKTNPYKGLSVNCDKCDKSDIHPQGFMHCYKCDEDFCMKCIQTKDHKPGDSQTSEAKVQV